MIDFDKDALYPLLFEPAYKQVLWGGRRLAEKFGRPLPPDGPPIGESWEICDRAEFESPVMISPDQSYSTNNIPYHGALEHDGIITDLSG